jgi:hypothetical protein
MHFGENQLSRSLIGLSPLTTGHPPGFQPWWVRASTPSYRRFTLPMARSLRFGSRTRDYCVYFNTDALIGLAFATATPPGLTSPRAANSQAHSSKGTPSRPHRNRWNDAPTDCRHTVSGTLSLPSRGTFHPSLTVLVHYRSPGSIQPYQVVLADSHGISRAPRYSGTAPRACSMSSTGLSPTTVGHSHAVRLHHRFLTRRQAGRPDRHVPQPPARNPCRVSHAQGLG